MQVVVEGLAYQDDFVTREEERELLVAARARRRPDRTRAGRLAQVLVSRYPEGAGIGWHRDAPMFGSRK